MRVLPVYGIILGILAATGCQVPSDTETNISPSPGPLTFTRDIAPILFEHCAPCHRPGQPGPFSVLTYTEVKVHARQIATAVARRSMPPWQPEAGYGKFRNERRLAHHQIETIRQWVSEGAIEGQASDLPPPPVWHEGWQLGQPDVVVEMPRPYTRQPGGVDIFRNFTVPIPVDSHRYVRGIEFRPGNSRLVHHATLFLDPRRSARRLDDEDPEPGYEGMLTEGLYTPDGHFLAWTPGRVPSFEADEMAWRLDKGTDLVIQLHLLPSTSAQVVRPSVGFFFTDTPPTRAPFVIKLGSKAIDIPAGTEGHVVRDTYVLPVDLEVLSVYPHAHYLGKEMKAFAILPDGRTEWLIWIKNWNTHWQDLYRYESPVLMPRGTTITMEYSYDNSANNDRNPHHPPERVVYGPLSSDEMGDLWLQVLPRLSSEVEILRRDASQRELKADIAYAEMMLRINPTAERHNLLAARFLEAGRVPEAIPHLQQALRLRPDYAEVHNNLGNALQFQGKLTDAISHFREALRINPGEPRVHLNLGNALNAVGRLDEAIDHFRRATSLDPDLDEAHNNLGVVLGSRNEINEAIRHFRRAIEINPDYVDAHNNLGIALSVRGERAEAIRHFQRVLEIRPDHVGAKENLKAVSLKQ